MSYALAVQVQTQSEDQTPLPSGTLAPDHASSDPTWSDDESHEVAFTAGNPRVEHITGVVHLYRDTQAPGSLTGTTTRTISEERGDRLAVLAIPSDMGVADFCQFLGGYLAGVRQMRLVRRGDTPGLCLVLLRFKDSTMAAGFYGDYNGRPGSTATLHGSYTREWYPLSGSCYQTQHQFSSLEPEVICRLVYVKDVQVTAARESDSQPAPPPQPSPGQIELPTCPVCLDRLDEETSGLVTTVCNHRFHSECLGKWGDASCPVCRYCQETSAAASRCQVCESSSDLWICLICGHVGCGRYRTKHAVDHWKETSHCYALELQTQRVWDYAADGYVHRLVQSKTDGKLVEVPSGDLLSIQSSIRVAGESIRATTLEPGVEDALVASKLDALAGEYSALLAGQLESQRAWYDGRQAKAIAEAEASRAEAVASAERGEAAAEGARTAAKDAERAKRTAERKLVEATAKLKAVRKESEASEAMNSQLLANQASLKASLAAAQATNAERAAQIVDLNEQVRDLMMYFEAQRVVEASGGDSSLSNGTVLPMPQQAPEGSGKRRTPRKSR